MGNYNFWKDLESAKEIEKEAVNALSRHLELENVQFNNDYKYDFVVTVRGKQKKYEVKHDIMSTKTGNMAVEYECRGKFSGILTTEADYWIYKLDSDFYLIALEKLRSLIDDQKYFRLVTGGDRGSNTKMFLFKLATMKEEMILL